MTYYKINVNIAVSVLVCSLIQAHVWTVVAGRQLQVGSGSCTIVDINSISLCTLTF